MFTWGYMGIIGSLWGYRLYARIIGFICGLYRDITPKMKDHLENNVENEVYWVYIGVTCFGKLPFLAGNNSMSCICQMRKPEQRSF